MVQKSLSTSASPGIQSAETALAILTRLAQLGGLRSVSELGRSMGMPRAKMHRYLVSLERCAYVEQDPASARYRLGPQALHTGLAALADVDFVGMAASGLAALAERVGHTVFVSVWGEHGPTIVQWRDAQHPVTVNVRVGSVLSLLNSATGRAYAAWMPESLILPGVLAQWRQAPPGSLRIPGVEAPVPDEEALAQSLREEWSTLRRQGYTTVSGHFLAGINSVAVPVFDAPGHMAGALTALGLQHTFDLDPAGRPVTALLAAGAELSRRLGWNG